MSPSQQARTSRKKDIPVDFILNWQCPSGRGPAQVVRRPATACEACRVAKVKCSGTRECDRCANRGIHCKYNIATTNSNANANVSNSSTTPTPPTSTSASPSDYIDPPRPTNEHSSSSTTEDVAMLSLEQMSTNWWADAASPPYEDANKNMVDLSKGGRDQPVELFDWSSLDNSQKILDSLSGSSSTMSPDLFQSLIANPPVSSVAQPPTLEIQEGASASSGSMFSFSNPASSQTLSSSTNSTCQCRPNLILQIPNVQNAMQEQPRPQHDRVFRVTGNVLRACLDIINCGSCQISYADLICITAVLQQTEMCFKYISNGDLTSAIKVSVGDYQVSIGNGINLQRMVVLDLVTQANAVLYSLRLMDQNLVPSQANPASRLTQSELKYLQEALDNFEITLRSITDLFHESGSDSVGLVEKY